jgi:hypothetical protein
MEQEKIIQEPQVENVNKTIQPKKSLINKKSIIILIVVSLVAIFLMLIYSGTELDKKSHLYVDKTVPVIITSWNSQELTSRASQELLEVASEEKVELLFKQYSDKLGQMKEYKGSNGEVRMHFEILCQQGMMCQRVTANYVAEAIFEKGLATIEIGMILKNDRWEIFYFTIMSDAFLRS